MTSVVWMAVFNVSIIITYHLYRFLAILFTLPLNNPSTIMRRSPKIDVSCSFLLCFFLSLEFDLVHLLSSMSSSHCFRYAPKYPLNISLFIYLINVKQFLVLCLLVRWNSYQVSRSNPTSFSDLLRYLKRFVVWISYHNRVLDTFGGVWWNYMLIFHLSCLWGRSGRLQQEAPSFLHHCWSLFRVAWKFSFYNCFARFWVEM